MPASTIVHLRRGPTRKRPTSSSGFWVALSPMRWSLGASVSSSSRSRVSARCAPRLVAATAWISSTITASAPVSISRACEVEHQVERLGRRDEDVGRVAAHGGPLALRRVAGAHGDRHVGADAAQRRAEVALDVVGQRLQRRDVDEARPALALGQRIGRQAVERPQERGERLARSGGRRDEDVIARRDGRPRLLLRRRRLRERGLEPVTNAGCEGGQRHASRLASAGRRLRALPTRAAGLNCDKRGHPGTKASTISASSPFVDEVARFSRPPLELLVPPREGTRVWAPG